jgi:hypothetical protein
MHSFAADYKSLFVAVVVFGCCLSTSAQPQPPKPEHMETEATLKGIKGNLCQVTIGQNTWLLQIDPKLKVEIKGTAELDYLPLVQLPLMVRYKTELNNRTKSATTPVTELEILNVSEQDRPGVLNDSVTSFNEQPKKGPPPMTGNYQVTGPVTSYKNGTLQIGQVKASIDPAAKISMLLKDPKSFLLLPPGATMKIKLDYYPMLEGKGLLKEVDATLAEPLAAPKKPNPKSPGGKPAEPKSAGNRSPEEKATESQEGASQDASGKSVKERPPSEKNLTAPQA